PGRLAIEQIGLAAPFDLLRREGERLPRDPDVPELVGGLARPLAERGCVGWVELSDTMFHDAKLAVVTFAVVGEVGDPNLNVGHGLALLGDGGRSGVTPDIGSVQCDMMGPAVRGLTNGSRPRYRVVLPRVSSAVLRPRRRGRAR